MEKKEHSLDVLATGKTVRKKAVKRVTAGAMQNTQLTLFQSFLCNTVDERSQLSNTIALWDSIPRYSVSRLAMAKMRSPERRLESLKLDFRFQDRALRAVIHPARIEVEEKTTGKSASVDFYPSAAEELVEDALRKIAADTQQGYFDKPQYQSGVQFTLHQLREELKRRGHTRAYHEIIMSLDILAQSTIRIMEDDERSGGFAVSTYLPSLASVSRADWEADPEAKWVAQFHPLVTRSIDQLTYRQFNYHQMMSLNSQLARWIHKQLAMKFTFASHGRTFDMRFSTIKRDSALLNGYTLNRKAFEAVDDALNELKARKVLMFFEKNTILGLRNKLEDAVYTLTPSLEFIREMKAANKRLLLAGQPPQEAA